MAKLHVRVYCQAYYDSEIEVPNDLTKEEAFQYAEDKIDEIPLTNLEYLPDSDELDWDDLDNETHTYLTRM